MKREATYSSTIGNFLAKYAIFIVTIVLFIALSVMSSGFLTSQNLVNILRQQSFVGMIAVGMTFVIITGGIDLSVGAILAFSGMCTAIFCVTDANGATVLPLGVAVMIGIAVSVLIGCGNGLLVAKGKVAPFIATLGMQTILRGAALLLNDGRPVINLSNEFKEIGGGSIIGIPIPVVVFIIVIIVGILLLHFLRFGRHIYAVGGNEKAAAASGIHTDRIKIGAYVLAALFAGISGIVLSARLNSASPISGGEYELNAIASVVIGGTSLAGGIGTMAGTLVGIMLLGILTNGLDLLNVSAYLQQVIRGSIIIIATLLDRRTGKMIAGM